MNARVVMLLDNDLSHDSRVQREAQALAAAGYIVTIIARLYDKPLPYEEYSGSVRILRSNYLSQGWHRLRYAPLRKAYTFTSLLASGYPQPEFCRLAASQPADIIHAHDREMLRLGLRLARKQGALLIYDSHEFHPALVNEGIRSGIRHRIIGQIMRLIHENTERRLIRFANQVITVNDSIARIMATTFNIPLPKVVMNCPDLATPMPNPLLRRMAGLPDQAVAILYQGVMAPGRGLHQLIDSVPLLPEHYHLIFLGYGPMEPALRQHVDRQNLAARLHFLPAVSPAELLDWSAAADIGIATIEAINDSKRYATPNKLFEYLMAGLPVVASDLPEMRRIMERACAGQMINTVDPPTIAAAIRAVIESPDYQRYREQGRAAAVERYNWTIESGNLLDAYQRTLASSIVK